ncbi:uncharacterized protein LOC131427726 [Malaya genurostris]|uniref:uncharacterized protein LOC131427726 n=1 Tax=Malaya genurostris TaxID=325434 RepID=UPI0026F3AECB|nr:uncharacterized protein LOC131427726 [Malaya genurostris]
MDSLNGFELLLDAAMYSSSNQSGRSLNKSEKDLVPSVVACFEEVATTNVSGQNWLSRTQTAYPMRDVSNFCGRHEDSYWSNNITISNVIASTPIRNRNERTELKVSLGLSSSATISCAPSFNGIENMFNELLDLRTERKIEQKRTNPTFFEALDLRAECKLSQSKSTVDCSADETGNCSEDSDWIPEGDVTLLNDFTINECFEKYRYNLSDADESEYDTDENIPTTAVRRFKHKKQAKHEASAAQYTYPKRTTNKKIERLRKEKGVSYMRTNVILERRIRSDCHCRMNCKDKFSNDTRETLLRNFFKLKNSVRNQFISSHIAVKRTARSKVINSRRQYSRVYSLPDIWKSIVCMQLLNEHHYKYRNPSRMGAAHIRYPKNKTNPSDTNEFE